MNDFAKLVLGFLLTTICGGLLGFLFQRRHARHQWLLSRWEKELEEAQTVFGEVSRLLDRRLYRTKRLLWALNRPDVLQQRLDEYITIVTEWNDNINRILALIAINFTDDLRNEIDYKIGDEFVQIGRLLEDSLGGKPMDGKKLEERINKLANRVYSFNLSLLREIRNRKQTLHVGSGTELKERRRARAKE
ncbi:MAG: hypothetical protein ACXW3C_05115 [Pyrinomonadaceae bacterium]